MDSPVFVSFLQNGREVTTIEVGSFDVSGKKEQLKKTLAALKPPYSAKGIFFSENASEKWKELISQGSFAKDPKTKFSVSLPETARVLNALIPGCKPTTPVIVCDNVELPKELRFVRSNGQARFRVVSVKARQEEARAPVTYYLSCTAVDGDLITARENGQLHPVQNTQVLMRKNWVLGKSKKYSPKNLELLNESLQNDPLIVDLTLATQQFVYFGSAGRWEDVGAYWHAIEFSEGQAAIRDRFEKAWEVELPSRSSGTTDSARGSGVASPAASSPAGIILDTYAPVASTAPAPAVATSPSHSSLQRVELKNQLVARWGNQCQATGSTVAVEACNLNGEASDSLDERNGILLTATVRHAFEKGLVTFNFSDNIYIISVREDLREDPILGSIHGKTLGGERGKELYEFTKDAYHRQNSNN